MTPDRPTTPPMTEPSNEQTNTGAASPAAAAHAAAAARDGREGTTATGHRITVRGLNAWYGDLHSIKDFTIDFAPSRVTALIGPSGSGKSTVVRCINRMHEEIPGARAQGEVKLDDTDLYGDGVDVVACAAPSGWSSRSPTRSRRCRSSTTSRPGCKLTGTKVKDMRERVEQSLRGAALWEEVKDRLHEPGIGLSGGQQQRLCIARTIAVEPEVILMDEPCSALDPIATLKVEELIQELKDRYTIVIVTHNMQQAARVADTTAFMLDGELIEHAATDKMFSTPDDSRTEEYVTGKFG